MSATISTFPKCPGEFLIIQKPDNTFYFLCSNDCDIVGICQSFDWYIVSKDAFNDRLIIGIGLSDKESINGELYRVQDETTLILWRDILRFTFESDFVRQFFPYNTHFKGKMRIDGALCFYIHDYYPTRCKDISVFDRKTSNLVFRFKEGRQAALVAKIFSLCIARMPFFKEKAANTVLIPIRRQPVNGTSPVLPVFAAFSHIGLKLWTVFVPHG